MEMTKTRLTVVDLYCGAGGLSEGIRQARLPLTSGEDAGFDVVHGFDRDRDAIATYRKNHFGHLPIARQEALAPCRDVTGLTATDIQTAAGVDHVDLVVGGPNCQGVSGAGLRNPDDQRNRMFREFLRLVTVLRPTWFLMENVPGLTHRNNRALLHEIMAAFASLPGYEVAADVLLAADFGCAQLRYRLFVIGTNSGHPIRFPVPTHRRSPSGAQQELPLELPFYTTVDQAIRDLEEVRPQARIDRSIDLGNGRLIHNHVVFALEAENRRRIGSIGEGKDWRAMPMYLLPQRYFGTRASDQKGAYGRLAWEQPAYTITASAGNVSAGPFTHPSQDRPISVREAARLQGFDDNYVFCGEADSMYRQVGNAVPPPLAHAVAEMLLLCHFTPESATSTGRSGRITLELLEGGPNGARTFPVLTPRFPSESHMPRPVGSPRRQKTAVAVASSGESPPRFVEESALRASLDGQILTLLYNEAAQPGNVKAAKRARVMLAYLNGESLEELCALAKVSEKSIRKWVDGFYRLGMDGWRAHHTSLATLAGDDDDLLQALTAAVARVRAHHMDDRAQEPADGDLSASSRTPTEGVDENPRGRRQRSRPHMNPYLRELIARYGDYSVEDLTARVESRLGTSVGTQYVGDLLALADVILGKDPSASASAAAAAHADRLGSNATPAEAVG